MACGSGIGMKFNPRHAAAPPPAPRTIPSPRGTRGTRSARRTRWRSPSRSGAATWRGWRARGQGGLWLGEVRVGALWGWADPCGVPLWAADGSELGGPAGGPVLREDPQLTLTRPSIARHPPTRPATTHARAHHASICGLQQQALRHSATV